MNNLKHHHAIHSANRDQIIRTLNSAGIDTKLVNRFEYRLEDINWADAVITVGGDGTFLMAASRILDSNKPVIGINSDPESSVGHLCLPSEYSSNLKPVLEKIKLNKFQWRMRQRIRVTVEGENANDEPIELHDQQLQHPEYRFLDLESRSNDESRSSKEKKSVRKILPIRALNEVFIGETLSSRVSYYELGIDSDSLIKMRSSGLTISTGTGSTSWFFNINKLTPQCVHSLVKMIREETGADLDISDPSVHKITNKFNNSLIFDAAEPRMAYTIRDPIVFSTGFNSNPRGFATEINVRSRMFDACIVLDGGLSYKFNDGAIAKLQILPDDALRTVQLN